MRVFKTGAIDMRMVITIVNRVALIQDRAPRNSQDAPGPVLGIQATRRGPKVSVVCALMVGT
jgi:hypothetical protein